jgi:hypothetical protein
LRGKSESATANEFWVPGWAEKFSFDCDTRSKGKGAICKYH